MFRLQNNTPEVYINGSRDFQLFCRLYDTINNGVRFDANTIPNILDPLQINDRMLDLLCTKMGFFTRENIPENVLRVILDSFPYAVKYKGSIKGIKYAVCSILKLEGTFEEPEVIIDNKTYTIQIYTSVKITNKKALIEYLKYIIPLGYTVTIEQYTKYHTSKNEKPTEIRVQDKIKYMINPISSTSQIRGSDRILNSLDSENNDFNFIENIENDYIGTYMVTSIVGNINNLELGNKETGVGYSSDRLQNIRDNIDKSENQNIPIGTETIPTVTRGTIPEET